MFLKNLLKLIRIKYYGIFIFIFRIMPISNPKTLKVTSGSDTTKTTTNLVYVSKATFDEFCPKYNKNDGLPILEITPASDMVKQDPYYYCFDIYSNDVKDDEIILNKVQRDNVGKLGKTISCKRVISLPALPAEYICFSLQKLGSTIQGDYDVNELGRYILENYKSHVVCEGQSICIKFKEKNMKIVVKRFKNVSLQHAQNEKEALITSLMGKKEESENIVKYVRIDENTKFEFEASSDLKVKFLGQNVGFE